MSINLKMPDIRELKPKITVCGVGGAGGNAVNNMITSGLEGVDFIVANTDAQALSSSKCERIIQMGLKVTEGLGAGSHPEVGSAAAQEVLDEIRDHLAGSHMCFITAGMGGGTGTGAAPVIAKAARDMGILTVGVVTKPFQFEGQRRMRTAEAGILELQQCVDTLIVIPNQNLFRVANERTTFADAFALADQVLYSGVACITDLMVKEGLINLDFADVRSVMRDMGKAMMGTGEASGDNRAITAAEAAIANPLLDETSMRGARGLLISITGGRDLTLYELDEAASRIRQEVDEGANIIVGATFDAELEGAIRVSVVATGIDSAAQAAAPQPVAQPALRPAVAQAPVATPAAAPAMTAPMPSLAELTEKLKASSERIQAMNATRQPPVQAAAADVAGGDVKAHEPMEITQTIPLIQPRMTDAVSLTKMDVRPALFTEPVQVEGAREPVSAPPVMPAEEFLPPAAERPIRPARMPTIDELPMPAQAQMRAQQHPAPAAPNAEKRRTSLIERLAGMARRDAGEDGMSAAEAQPKPAATAPVAAPSRPAPLSPADYGRRPAQPAALSARNGAQGLDVHGRPAQQKVDEEHLDIPAFLRRQSN